MSHRKIEQAPRPNARRIVIVIFLSWRRNIDEAGGELIRRTDGGQRHGWSSAETIAAESSFILEVRTQRVSHHVLHQDAGLPVCKHRRLRTIVVRCDPIAW